MLYALSNWGSLIFLTLLFGGMSLIGFVAAVLRNKIFCIVFAAINAVVMVLFTLAIIVTPTLILDFDFMVLVGAVIVDVFYIVFFVRPLRSLPLARTVTLHTRTHQAHKAH